MWENRELVWENRAECGRGESVGEQGVWESRECGRAESAGEQRVESRGEQEVQKSELPSIVHAE